MKPRIMTNTADKLHNLVRLCMLPRLGCHTLVCKRLMCPAPVRVSCCYGRLVQYLTDPLALQLFEGRPGVLGSTGGFIDAVVATCFLHLTWLMCVCVSVSECVEIVLTMSRGLLMTVVVAGGPGHIRSATNAGIQSTTPTVRQRLQTTPTKSCAQHSQVLPPIRRNHPPLTQSQQHNNTQQELQHQQSHRTQP